MFEEILHELLHAFEDSVKMLPFLLAAYLFIEYLEHKGNGGLQKLLTRAGKYGPAGAALLGAVPQCGFSVAAANFYAGRIITRGTLIAVFLSTSDEAIPVLLASPGHSGILLQLIAVKVGIGMIAGFLIDFADRRQGRCTGLTGGSEHNDLCHSCHCEEGWVKAAVKHALTVFFFILIVTCLLNLLLFAVGEEQLERLLMTDSLLQPLLAAAVGFIPNCAASVVLTRLYIAGTLSFGSAVAGLSVGAGVGLAVLFKTNKNMKDNLAIIGLLYAVGAGCGVVIQMIWG